ncbi:MAG: hypothetical protein DPW14_14505 [Planctomycetes bacterium]|nr:hypothetical protein [Planctomycetota bacterium]
MKWTPLILLALLGVAWLGYVAAQDAPKAASAEIPGEDELEPLLAYLNSDIPEQRNSAEARLRLGAARHFERLVELLNGQRPRGRELLLAILVQTEAPGRVRLCVDTLCRQDARRRERISAAAALRTLEEPRVLEAVKARLAQGNLSAYERVQCYRALGELALPEAQQLAEREREAAPPDSLVQFFAEDALLRSLLAAEVSQPAWTRYQRRRKEAPQVELRVLHAALSELAQPGAMDRTLAEMHLAEMLKGDSRLLLALARSPLPERATFALSVLRRRAMGSLAAATQAVMLDLVTSGEQMTALLAVDVAVSGTPPDAAGLGELRPVVSAEAMTRLEAVLEGLAAAGDLAELRARCARIEVELVPLLRRMGPADGEVRELMKRLDEVNGKLQELELVWRLGWRREFESEILGFKRR